MSAGVHCPWATRRRSIPRRWHSCGRRVPD